jgi:Nucleotidyl transferase AbiEii toxin, Type IV TA system
MSKIHLELFDPERQKIFTTLGQFKDVGYLAGGTALMLQIQHRKSVDFDVFISHALNNRFRLSVETVFGKQNLEVNSEDQITFSPQAGIEVTFLWYYWKPLQPLLPTEALPLASLEDIAADKAHTLGRRAMWRDYVDLFCLLKNQGMTVGTIIDAATKKFGGDFVKEQFLEQLSYFGDITIVPVDYIQQTFTPEEIKIFLQQQVQDYLKTILPV